MPKPLFWNPKLDRLVESRMRRNYEVWGSDQDPDYGRWRELNLPLFRRAMLAAELAGSVAHQTGAGPEECAGRFKAAFEETLDEELVAAGRLPEGGRP